jgi:hypothetical protein
VGVRLIGALQLAVSLLGLIASPLAIFGTIFLFDAPGSADSTPTLLLAAALCLMPLACLLAVWHAWKAIRLASRRHLALSGATLLGWLGSVVAALAIVQSICGGRFAC